MSTVFTHNCAKRFMISSHICLACGRFGVSNLRAELGNYVLDDGRWGSLGGVVFSRSIWHFGMRRACASIHSYFPEVQARLALTAPCLESCA